MNRSPANTCPRCGAPLPAGAVDQPCPACLLSGVLDAPSGETLPMAPTAAPPSRTREDRGFPRRLGGYRLHRVLGRGGMGTVYEAEQLTTGRRVALKMLEHELDSPEMRQRFLREGRLAARVNHPNSLYIFGSEEIEGRPVITMEIAGSGTLNDRIKRRGPLPVKEAVDAVLDVLTGLESAYAEGVLHRDVKPSNCFVCPDGSVKVGDFGLSVSTLTRSDTFITAQGKILGTPAFASPEQLRGDAVDVRTDVYSVGATLFTLLTNRAPFEGDNAVQVVANAVNQKPKSLAQFRDDIPPGLDSVVARCLAKEPDGRYPDYASLRNALLPFSSREPEPASLKIRAAAGWPDFLIAFLVPYVVLMLAVGAREFHFQPFIERSLYSARFYFAFLAFGFLYFAIVEGLWGGGLGKRLKGLRVVRTEGRSPGFPRALLRIVLIILAAECVRIPFLLATFSAGSFEELTSKEVWLYIGASNVCPWIPPLLTLTARRENGFATLWDLLTGTRVVIVPTGTVRPRIESALPPGETAEAGEVLGPYRVLEPLAPGEWLVGLDPVLRRQVWLLRREASGPTTARRHLGRPGRLRWLQKVEADGAAWDAFEATPGVPFLRLVANGKQVPWASLRHWLYDLSSELWHASADATLPSALCLEQIWITSQGSAVLLDQPYPGGTENSRPIPVTDVAGQQQFLGAVAAHVDLTRTPLHARGVLQNLEARRFEKLSFLAGTLRGLLHQPAEVSRGIRAGSIFMLPLYVWILVFVGNYRMELPNGWPSSWGWIALSAALWCWRPGRCFSSWSCRFVPPAVTRCSDWRWSTVKGDAPAC
ncbi:MAG: serine/threonine protein kinase [Verrucomicrobiales bacterium]|nr:serine/threonine protein kinase [Verrucomicrobiales bacterium]